MALAEQYRPEQVTFTALGEDRYRCDLCGREVKGYRGIGGHKGLHTGQARAKFQRRAEEEVASAYRAAGAAANGARAASLSRKTLETDVMVTLSLDGAGAAAVDTGHGFLDHMLAQLARHGLFDLSVRARGDSTGWHHLVEDVGIMLGRALRQALGDGRGITRMGHSLVPLDEALALVAVDLGGRGYASLDTGLSDLVVEGLPGSLLDHFLESMAVEGRMTLHVKVFSARDAHHRAEAVFKALARALRDAVQVDPRQPQVPSTKGTITG